MKIHNTYISYAFGNHSLELNEEIAIQSIERQHVMLICYSPVSIHLEVSSLRLDEE